jgi:hypothetical protein
MKSWGRAMEQQVLSLRNKQRHTLEQLFKTLSHRALNGPTLNR